MITVPKGALESGGLTPPWDFGVVAPWLRTAFGLRRAKAAALLPQSKALRAYKG